MTDPISGQMASQAVESLASQDQAQGVTDSPSTTDFADCLEALDQVDAAQLVEAIESLDGVEAIEGVEEISTDDFIQRLMQEESEIQAMMERCMSGEELGTQDMLQMQALIYSYSQRVDLATKVVDKATSGVQQVMNTQV